MTEYPTFRNIVDSLRDLDHYVLVAAIDEYLESGESGEGREEPKATTDTPAPGANQVYFLRFNAPEYGDTEIQVEVWNDGTSAVSLMDFQEGFTVYTWSFQLPTGGAQT